MLKSLHNRARRFAREEDGLVMTEFLILLPLLIWTFMAMTVYWDAFRTINEAQKASYAVADLISRQSSVDRSFIRGMEKVMEGLLGRPNVVSMRITSLQWDKDAGTNGEYIVLFSESPWSKEPKLTKSAAQQLKDRIPVLTHGDTTVVLETWTNYTPAFDVGIPYTRFENFITTRPRYYRRVCLTETPTSCPEEV